MQMSSSYGIRLECKIVNFYTTRAQKRLAAEEWVCLMSTATLFLKIWDVFSRRILSK